MNLIRKLILTLAAVFAFSSFVFAADDNINVYYFYAKPRCATCVKIENFTKSAVESMKDKSVIYKAIDMEKAESKSMVKKYNLYTKSVIVSKVKNGKEEWKNLDKIWLKVGNEKDFKNYIITEVKK